MRISCVQSSLEPPPSGPGSSVARSRQSRRWPLRAWRWMVGAALLGTAGGCSDGAIISECRYLLPAPQDQEELTISTWWSKDACGQDGRGEACAAHELMDGYTACSEGKVSLDHKLHREQTVEDIAYDHGGDGSIINGGSDLFGLAGCGQDDPTLVHLAQLGTLENPTASFLTERLPAELESQVSCDGKLFGAVLGLHSLNNLFYHEGLVEALGIDVRGPISVTELPALLKRVSESDPRYKKPLVIHSDGDTWSRFLIENLMVALSTPDVYGNHGYKNFWSRLSGGEVTSLRIDLTLFERALALAGELAPYIQKGSEHVDPIVYLEQGSNVFTITGDWVVPDLPEYVKYRAFPGTEGIYVYTTDVAVVTRRAKEQTLVSNTDPIMGWLKATTFSDVQFNFGYAKNAISPITRDGDRTRAKTREELFVVDGVQLVGVPGLPSYVPYKTFDDMESKIESYMECLTTTTMTPPNQGCMRQHAALVDYIFDEYCKVISRRAPELGERCLDLNTLPASIRTSN
jgi:hypothetical protein